MNTSRRSVRLLPFLLIPLLLGCATHREAGTGDVSFRLVWNGISDLDLFVIDPSGDCASWSRRETRTGGVLDIDCNAGTGHLCEKPVENVYWPVGRAPAGEYSFWVRAHSLVPAEVPLRYQIQILRGQRIAWIYRGEMRLHQETIGPFTYEMPSGRASKPLSDAPRSDFPCLSLGPEPPR